jgi:hypothetical protein
MAETKAAAELAFDAVIESYTPKYDKAADCLSRDRDTLLAFYDFPAEQWKHLRTTNPIESTFATVRHRTSRSKGCLRPEAAGDPGPWRQQALLGRRDWDADALRDIVRDYVIEHLADDDAVMVIDETGFLKQGKAWCGVARQYTGSAGKITNCQIGVFACLRFAPRSCVHRSYAVSSEGKDRRSRSSGSRIRAPRCRLCDQAKACDANDCTRHSCVCPIQMGCWRYCLRCWRHRTATASRRQRLCTRGQQRSCISVLGQGSIGRRHGRGHRPDAALVRLETPVGRGRNQRTTAA